jgi:hypothetical protein
MFPFAVIFILFICGKHKLSLIVAEKFADQNFIQMYKDYIDLYDCKGIPHS